MYWNELVAVLVRRITWGAGSASGGDTKVRACGLASADGRSEEAWSISAVKVPSILVLGENTTRAM